MEYKASTFIPLGVKKAIFQEAVQEYILCTLQDDSLHFPDFNLRIKEMRRDDEYSCPAQGIGQKALDSEHLEPIAVGSSFLLGTIPSSKLEQTAPSRLNIQTRWHINRIDNAASIYCYMPRKFNSVSLAI